MNKDVREYLIAVARQDNETVFYSELVSDNRVKIDLATEKGQAQLRKLLVEISTYEHEQGRPMLTALAINKKEKDQGPGFYELAERFGHGKKSELRKNWWGLGEAKRVREYWKNDDHYNQFASLEAKKTSVNKIESLFDTLTNSNDYDYVEGWADMYISFVADVRKLQEALRDNSGLSITNNKLYKELTEPVQSYKGFMNKWLKERSNGISSRGQSVLSEDNYNIIVNDAVFKVIAKEVITTPSVETYNDLVDWWYHNEAIGNRPLLINRAVAACLPERLSSTVDNKKFWYVINVLQKQYGFAFKDDPQWNWFAANEQLTTWLDQHLRTALNKLSENKLEQHIWRNIFVWLIYEKYYGKPKIEPNELVRKNPPEKGYSEMPDCETSFDGFDVDFEAKARIQKDLGDAGEELVKRHEKKELEKMGMYEKSDEVRIAKPGEGFDVYSFDENGNEKFIEVKTTPGKNLTSFYLTRHEIKFMRKHKGQYSLYRVYNFDEENNSGEFFELVGDIEQQLIMEPTQYEVVFKDK